MVTLRVQVQLVMVQRLTASAASYSTVAISRSLTSGATLAATYSTLDDSLTLKASVAF